MSLDKLVDSTQLDADLTSVANAIRTKGGTSASLAFPADFVTAIGNISGGGGGSSWTKIASREDTVSTTSTSAASAFTIAIGSQYYTKDKIIWVHIRDKAGQRPGRFFGSDAFFINYYKANNQITTIAVPAVLCIRYTSSSAFSATAGQYGVYGYSISATGTLTVRQCYHSSFSLTIDGTYVTSVYALDLPDSLTLF